MGADLANANPLKGWPLQRLDRILKSRIVALGRDSYILKVMRVQKFSFGSIRIDGVTYEHDVVIDRGDVRKRTNAPIDESTRGGA
jgi:hypothetical protein